MIVLQRKKGEIEVSTSYFRWLFLKLTFPQALQAKSSSSSSDVTAASSTLGFRPRFFLAVRACLMGWTWSSGTSDSQENSWSDRNKLSSSSWSNISCESYSTSSRFSDPSEPLENFSNCRMCSSPRFFFFFLRRFRGVPFPSSLPTKIRCHNKETSKKFLWKSHLDNHRRHCH